MRYFFGFLVSIGLIILVFVMVLRGFSGDDQKNKIVLSDYATSDAVVQMTVDGPIIAEEDHRGYRITVGRTQVTVEALKGYEYEPLETKSYSNNQESYINFLRALEVAGYTKGNPKAKNTDPRGMCAVEKRMIFKILNGASEVQNYWATSCSGQGNFKGNREQVRQLFNKQVPRVDQKVINKLGV